MEADYNGMGRYFPGKITRINQNGTFDIAYDDGSRETSVESSSIRPLGGGGGGDGDGEGEAGELDLTIMWRPYAHAHAVGAGMGLRGGHRPSPTPL